MMPFLNSGWNGRGPRTGHTEGSHIPETTPCVSNWVSSHSLVAAMQKDPDRQPAQQRRLPDTEKLGSSMAQVGDTPSGLGPKAWDAPDFPYKHGSMLFPGWLSPSPQPPPPKRLLFSKRLNSEYPQGTLLSR